MHYVPIQVLTQKSKHLHTHCVSNFARKTSKQYFSGFQWKDSFTLYFEPPPPQLINQRLLNTISLTKLVYMFLRGIDTVKFVIYILTTILFQIGGLICFVAGLVMIIYFNVNYRYKNFTPKDFTPTHILIFSEIYGKLLKFMINYRLYTTLYARLSQLA